MHAQPDHRNWRTALFVAPFVVGIATGQIDAVLLLAASQLINSSVLATILLEGRRER